MPTNARIIEPTVAPLMGSLPGGQMEGFYSARLRPARAGETTRQRRRLGRLPMSGAFFHEPVLCDQVTDLLSEVPPGIVIDATVGGGGHSEAMLERARHVRVLGIDQDGDAVEAATRRLAPFGPRAVVRRARFDQIAELADEERQEGEEVTGVLFDLGASSPQFDRPERGFSYRHDAPLDMRMDQRQPTTAADVVNTADVSRLGDLIRNNSDERYARRIARAIVASRPITSTAQLAEIVRNAIPAPARRTGGDPAKRTFQALRISVNDELEVLTDAIRSGLDVLAAGGRCVAISYHSGEDRIVKREFRQASTGGCGCPPGLPCGCGAVATVRHLTRGAWKPGAAEIAANPRAASARLRAVERLATEEAS